MQIAQQDIRQLTYVGSPGQPERTFVTLQAPIRQAAGAHQAGSVQATSDKIMMGN